MSRSCYKSTIGCNRIVCSDACNCKQYGKATNEKLNTPKDEDFGVSKDNKDNVEHSEED